MPVLIGAKQATVTLVITIKPQGNSGQYFLTDEVKQKLPSLPKAQTIMFGTPEGNLLRDDPRQQKLPLRDVGDAAPAVRAIAEPTVNIKSVG